MPDPQHHATIVDTNEAADAQLQETAATSEPLDLAPEATEASVPGAEKGITEFAITESAPPQADEWIDINV